MNNIAMKMFTSKSLGWLSNIDKDAVDNIIGSVLSKTTDPVEVKPVEVYRDKNSR